MKISDIILLTLLWALFSLPLITAYPATIALFETMKKWNKLGVTGQVWHNFFTSFRINLRVKLFYSIIFILVFGSIYINYYIYSPIESRLDATIIFLTFISNGISMVIFYVSCLLWNDEENKIKLMERLVLVVSKIVLHPFKTALLFIILIFITEAVIIFPILYFIVGIILGLSSISFNFSK